MRAAPLPGGTRQVRGDRLAGPACASELTDRTPVRPRAARSAHQIDKREMYLDRDSGEHVEDGDCGTVASTNRNGALCRELGALCRRCEEQRGR